MWTSKDKLKPKDFENYIDKINNLANRYGMSERLEKKNNGEFLFCEELKLIEYILNRISKALLLEYNKKYFYNLSTIDYKVVNKWDMQIELIENQDIKIYKYSDDYDDTQDTYRKLLYKQK